jgi:hypothetical protein
MCSSWKNGFNFVMSVESHTGHLPSFNCNFDASFSCSSKDAIWALISCIFSLASCSSFVDLSSFPTKSDFCFFFSKQPSQLCIISLLWSISSFIFLI